MEKQKKAIVVLDQGVTMGPDDGPLWVCCWGIFSPARG